MPIFSSISIEVSLVVSWIPSVLSDKHLPSTKYTLIVLQYHIISSNALKVQATTESVEGSKGELTHGIGLETLERIMS